MVSSSPAFRTTVSPFRLNDGVPGVPFHRRGTGKSSEPGQRQQSDGNYATEYASKYTGTMSPGAKTDESGVDIKPHSLRVEKADRSRPKSPMSPSDAQGTAGKKLQDEARLPQNPTREIPWADKEFKRVKDAFDRDRTHISYGIVQPRNDPLGHGTFDEERYAHWQLRLKTPQPPVHDYDLTGVFNKKPVRRYYTMNQMFYYWPVATPFLYSLNPTRPRTGPQ